MKGEESDESDEQSKNKSLVPSLPQTGVQEWSLSSNDFPHHLTLRFKLLWSTMAGHVTFETYLGLSAVRNHSWSIPPSAEVETGLNSHHRKGSRHA